MLYHEKGSGLAVFSLGVRDSTESLCCVLEQDTCCLVLVQPRKTENMTEKLLTRMLKDQPKQNQC